MEAERVDESRLEVGIEVLSGDSLPRDVDFALVVERSIVVGDEDALGSGSANEILRDVERVSGQPDLYSVKAVSTTYITKS